MITAHFLDGPGEGMALELSRAPRYLRVAVGSAGVSALERLNAEPRADEDLHVYRLLGHHGDSVGYATTDEIDGGDVRDTRDWRVSVQLATEGVDAVADAAGERGWDR